MHRSDIHNMEARCSENEDGGMGQSPLNCKLIVDIRLEHRTVVFRAHSYHDRLPVKEFSGKTPFFPDPFLSREISFLWNMKLIIR